MHFKAAFICALPIMLASAWFTVVEAEGSGKAESTVKSQGSGKTRVLQFPTEFSVGNVLLLSKPVGTISKYNGKVIANARGRVIVPAGKPLRLEPNGTLFLHPECLLKLPPDAFQSIELRFMSMTDSEDNLGDKIIPFVHHLSGLKNIDFDKSETTEKGMSELGTMPDVQVITIFDAAASGTCIKYLTGCKKLLNLRLGDCAVHDDDLRHLKKFTMLERLGLTRVNLTSRQLEFVAQCPHIWELELAHNFEIDDSALPFLLKLPKLKRLDLNDTKVSLHGLELLAKHGVLNITLPKKFANYTKTEQHRLQVAFPTEEFIARKILKNSVTEETLYAPFTR